MKISKGTVLYVIGLVAAGAVAGALTELVSGGDEDKPAGVPEKKDAALNQTTQKIQIN